MRKQSRNPASVDTETVSNVMMFEDVVKGVGLELEGLIDRLPDGVDIIERSIAEGSDPDGLALLLGSLPDAAEVDRLSAALDDLVALDALLALRDREAFTSSRAIARARDATK